MASLRGSCCAFLSMVTLLCACGATPPAGTAASDFSVVVGVPPEWASRIDEARYLEPAECSELCPLAFRRRVTSCHLARVSGAKTSSDTAAVVCNGGAQPEKP